MLEHSTPGLTVDQGAELPRIVDVVIGAYSVASCLRGDYTRSRGASWVSEVDLAAWRLWPATLDLDVSSMRLRLLATRGPGGAGPAVWLMWTNRGVQEGLEVHRWPLACAFMRNFDA